MNRPKPSSYRWVVILLALGPVPSVVDAGLQAVWDGRERSGDLVAASHFVICSPADCPTCLEFLMGEISRLSNERAWHGRWVMIVATESVVDSIFAEWLRDRYDPPLKLLTMERGALSARLSGGLTGTPCIVSKNADNSWSAPQIVTPGKLGAMGLYFDSLYVSGPISGKP